jgi:hypothetical protein
MNKTFFTLFQNILAEVTIRLYYNVQGTMADTAMFSSCSSTLILGWCILLRLFITKNDSTTLLRNLTCFYCKQTTLHVSAK